MLVGPCTSVNGLAWIVVSWPPSKGEKLLIPGHHANFWPELIECCVQRFTFILMLYTWQSVEEFFRHVHALHQNIALFFKRMTLSTFDLQKVPWYGLKLLKVKAFIEKSMHTGNRVSAHVGPT